MGRAFLFIGIVMMAAGIYFWTEHRSTILAYQFVSGKVLMKRTISDAKGQDCSDYTIGYLIDAKVNQVMVNLCEEHETGGAIPLYIHKQNPSDMRFSPPDRTVQRRWSAVAVAGLIMIVISVWRGMRENRGAA